MLFSAWYRNNETLYNRMLKINSVENYFEFVLNYVYEKQ